MLQWESAQQNAAQRNGAVTNALNSRNSAANTAFNISENISGEQSIHISPNPASEQALITFTLPQSSFCTLDLVNMRGEHLRRLADGVYYAGEHCINVDVHNLPQGQYFCRIRHNQTTTTIPFSVIR
jgi:hypothetical protein